MHIVFFEDKENRESLKPFTYTRPISEIRIGILTITEKWLKWLNTTDYSFVTEEYLSNKYTFSKTNDSIYINGSICPNPALVNLISELNNGDCIKKNKQLIAFKADEFSVNKLNGKQIEFKEALNYLEKPSDIFSKNAEELESDFDLLTKGRKSEVISDTNTLFNSDRIFLEKGAKVECSILNAKTGSIYIGKDAEIMEGSVVRGGLAMCNNSALKLATKIYGATTVGPFSKVGGEVNNSVIIGYSNKGHDGFLGNSVIGEWCNIGADSNNSNLKNNYSNVRIWDYKSNSYQDTGLQFCGLLMGDHSKCGINTMFNTGTVVGVSANIFGGGFPPKFIPSFSWGGSDGFSTYKLDKMLEVAEKVMERRNIILSKTEKDILDYLFTETKEYRS